MKKDLNLTTTPTALAKALARAGVTIEQARSMGEAAFLSVPGLGRKTWRDVCEVPVERVVITRHRALVEYLRERGLVGADDRVIEHAIVEDVRGKHAIGVMPLWLAAETWRVTEVTLRVPPEIRGRELTLEEVRQFVAGISTYEVRRV